MPNPTLPADQLPSRSERGATTRGWSRRPAATLAAERELVPARQLAAACASGRSAARPPLEQSAQPARGRLSLAEVGLRESQQPAAEEPGCQLAAAALRLVSEAQRREPAAAERSGDCLARAQRPA